MKNTITISSAALDRYNKLMQAECVDYEAEGIDRYTCVARWSAEFPEGFEVDIKVCASDCGEPLWCEAVLFQNGHERSCTDVCEELDGEWSLCADGQEYIVNVVKGT